jgi:hypothetical protein
VETRKWLYWKSGARGTGKMTEMPSKILVSELAETNHKNPKNHFKKHPKETFPKF